MLSGFPPLYQNKLLVVGVQDVVNVNKMKFQPYGDLVHHAFSQFNENFINNQDPHNQIETDETPGAMKLKYLNEIDSEEGEISKTIGLCNFMLQILLDDETA